MTKKSGKRSNSGASGFRTLSDVNQTDPHRTRDVTRQNPGELTIPSWMPAIIHELARKLYSQAVGNGIPMGVPIAAMIKRLIVDKRMKMVWEKLCPPTATERECEACRFLFHQTVIFFRQHFLLQPPSDYAAQAARLRTDAQAVGKRRPKKKYGRIAAKLDNAAQAYDDLDVADLPLEEIRQMVRDLSELLTAKFHSPNHQVAATICSVALGRNVSTDNVRNWLRD